MRNETLESIESTATSSERCGMGRRKSPSGATVKRMHLGPSLCLGKVRKYEIQ